jgi:hypothetical protein
MCNRLILNGFAKTAFAAVAAVGLMGSPVMAEGGSNSGNISVSGEMNIVTEYWFRGIAAQNQGLIQQPSLTVDFAVCEGVSVYTGFWNSIHNNGANGAGVDETDGWYESDWYIGAAIALSDELELDISYTDLYGPKDGGSVVQEIGVGLSYDDSGNPLLGDIALAPYVLFVFETEGGATAPPSPARAATKARTWSLVSLLNSVWSRVTTP